MAKHSNDDGQFFMVFVGGKQEPTSQKNECETWLMGVIALVIVMMFFVGLLKDAERNGVPEQSSIAASCWIQRGATWVNRCENSL